MFQLTFVQKGNTAVHAAAVAAVCEYDSSRGEDGVQDGGRLHC